MKAADQQADQKRGDMAKRLATSTLRRLSTRQIQTAVDGDYADGGNLLLRVRDGRAAWVFRYTAVDGRRREKGLGACHRNNAGDAGKSAMDARAAAERARTLIAGGRDPIDHQKTVSHQLRASIAAQRQEKNRERMTLCRVARDYHERVIEPARTLKHSMQWISSLENHLGSTDLWHKPIADIQAPELLDVVAGLQTRIPETASRIRQRLETIFDDAEFRKICHGNPARAIRRKLRETKKGRKRGRFAALPYRKVPAFVRDLRAQECIAARALEFGVMTAARTSEIIGCEWSEIDPVSRTWTVPLARMKGGEEHVVHLSDGALVVLARVKGLDKRWVFPSPMLDGRHLSNMAMLVLISRMDLRRETTPHGVCRASFSTWANETGAARPDVIEACLAHNESDKVRAAYNRARFNDERRAVLDAWAVYINGKGTETNVVPLRAA